MPDHSDHVSTSLWLRYGKRPFDIAAASLILVLLAPLFITTALAGQPQPFRDTNARQISL